MAMVGMDVPTLFAAMAPAIETVPGVAKAWSDPPNTPSANQLPGVVLIWDTPNDITPSNMTGGSMWVARIKAQILLPRKGDTPKEFAKSRALVTPIVDLFSVPVREVLPGLERHVDRLVPTGSSGDILINYAGHVYMGAEIYFEAKFHRRKQ